MILEGLESEKIEMERERQQWEAERETHSQEVRELRAQLARLEQEKTAIETKELQQTRMVRLPQNRLFTLSHILCTSVCVLCIYSRLSMALSVCVCGAVFFGTLFWIFHDFCVFQSNNSVGYRVYFSILLPGGPIGSVGN